MNPALWSTLPMELLQRVFAKLPFPNICRLKSLSKDWHLSLQSSSSEFSLALKESSPTILAAFFQAGDSEFLLHVLDGRNNRWHELHVCAQDGSANRSVLNISSLDWWMHINGVADAGLVCYVDKDPRTTLNHIFVINPMTGVCIRLPILKSLAFSELTMMQIVVDRDTYHYKVIVVKQTPPVEAEVYESEVQQWTKPKPSLGRIFGIAHDWIQNQTSIWSVSKLGPCAYDCRDGKYYDFGQDQEKWLGKEVISYTLMKARLFVLYLDRRENAAFISEYCVPENATSWVKEKRHSCFPGDFWRQNVTGRIHACNGFLIVFVTRNYRCLSDHNLSLQWIYDLATCEWHAIPPFPSRSEFLFSPKVMCELHWNIRP